MHDAVYDAAVVWLALLLVAMVVRVARSESTLTRLLALDVLVLVAIGLLAVLASTGGGVSLDAAVALALLSFGTTLALARYRTDGRPF